MANPDVAMAFQNPRVQAAIMDVSNFFVFIPSTLYTCQKKKTIFCQTLLFFVVVRVNLWFMVLVFAVLSKSFEYCQVSERQRGKMKPSCSVLLPAGARAF